MAEAAVQAIQAGVDMVILGDGKVLQPDSEDVQTPVIEALIEAVNQGTISTERLDDAVLSILRIKNDYGLFEDNGESNHAPYDIDLESHQVLVQDTTDQSMTLIRDEISALPLPTDSTLFISFPCVYPLEFDKKSFGEVAADSLFGKARECSSGSDTIGNRRYPAAGLRLRHPCFIGLQYGGFSKPEKITGSAA